MDYTPNRGLRTYARGKEGCMKDIVQFLRENDYFVVEGAEETRKLILWCNTHQRPAERCEVEGGE